MPNPRPGGAGFLQDESSDRLQSSGSAAALPIWGPPSPSSLSLFTSGKVTREWRQGITPTSPPAPSPGGRRGFWTGPEGDSHCPPCLAREQAPRGTQLGPAQDPKPPGLVSQGSGGLQSAHKLPRREGATGAHKGPPVRTRGGGQHEEPGQHSQEPPVTPPPLESQTRRNREEEVCGGQWAPPPGSARGPRVGRDAGGCGGTSRDAGGIRTRLDRKGTQGQAGAGAASGVRSTPGLVSR